MSDQKSKYKFDLEYQERLLASMISDRRFLERNFDVLDPAYFDDEILIGIAEASRGFFIREHSAPDQEALLEEIKKFIAPGRKRGEYTERLASVMGKVGPNSSYYQKTAIEFARKQSMSQAIREAESFLEDGDIDSVVASVQKASNVGNLDDGIAYDYFESVRPRAKEYRRDKTSSKTRVPTGFPSLDAVTDGGLDRGELGLVAAPPGHGKTTMLVNVGAAAILSGRTVFHATLELSRKMIALKYDQRFFGADLATIRKRPRSFRKAIEAVKEKMSGKLVISEFPTRSLTVMRLKAAASMVSNLGLLVVDFADLMKPVKTRDELRHELTEIYTSLRGLGGELGVPIWTASQANSLSLNVELITMKNLAECFNKAGIVDLGVSINQTNREASDSKVRLFVLKSRIGKSDVEIPCKVDWKRSRIEETEVENEDDKELDDDSEKKEKP